MQNRHWDMADILGSFVPALGAAENLAHSSCNYIVIQYRRQKRLILPLFFKSYSWLSQKSVNRSSVKKPQWVLLLQLVPLGWQWVRKINIYFIDTHQVTRKISWFIWNLNYPEIFNMLYRAGRILPTIMQEHQFENKPTSLQVHLEVIYGPFN